MLFKFFEGLVPPFPAGAPTPPPGKLIPFVWHYAKPFKWLFVGSILTSALIAIIEVFAYSFVGGVIDTMGQMGPAAFWEAHGVTLVMVCLLIAVVWPALSMLDELIILQGVLANMSMSIRWLGHRYLLRQSTSFFSSDFAGRVSTKLMQASLGARDTVIKLTNLFVYMTVYFVTAVVLFALNSPWLALPIVIWLGLYVSVAWIFLPRMGKWSEMSSDARSVLTGRVVDAYTNIQTVKLFASTQQEETYAKEGMQGMLDVVYPQNRVFTTMSGALHVINGLFIAGTLGLGAVLWSGDVISIGALAFAATMALRIQGLSHYFLWEAAFLFENVGSTIDGMKTLAKPLTVEDQPGATEMVPSGGPLAFEQVSFDYGQDRPVIRDLTLSIAPGEKVGLVGRSGAGKSTLVNLLLRLYDLDTGTIRLGGQDISEVTQDSLRAQIAVVTQDTSLLHRSIRENIAYGRPGASDADIEAAAKEAEAWDFVQTLEDQKGRRGLDAHVGERGVKLSGGQRQRIAIARVMLKDAPVLILDEATSALDSEAEAAIQDRMDALMTGKTVLAIAHRLSTIAAMDRLIVMDDGRIAEDGGHEELLAKGGIYAKLWARQSGGFL